MKPAAFSFAFQVEGPFPRWVVSSRRFSQALEAALAAGEWEGVGRLHGVWLAARPVEILTVDGRRVARPLRQAGAA